MKLRKIIKILNYQLSDIMVKSSGFTKVIFRYYDMLACKPMYMHVYSL